MPGGPPPPNKKYATAFDGMNGFTTTAKCPRPFRLADFEDVRSFGLPPDVLMLHNVRPAGMGTPRFT